LGLALVGPGFVLGRVYAFMQPVAKELENQKIDVLKHFLKTVGQSVGRWGDLLFGEAFS